MRLIELSTCSQLHQSFWLCSHSFNKTCLGHLPTRCWGVLSPMLPVPRCVPGMSWLLRLKHHMLPQTTCALGNPCVEADDAHFSWAKNIFFFFVICLFPCFPAPSWRHSNRNLGLMGLPCNSSHATNQRALGQIAWPGVHCWVGDDV